MTTDWILRAGNGQNFYNSAKYRIWGIQVTDSCDGKHFITNVQPGDRLWFVQNKSKGKILAVATYRSHNAREIGPLINMTMTNEELGWSGDGVDWKCDTEIHYTDLYNLNKCELLTHIQSPKTIRKYSEKCKVDLPVEYTHIVKYSPITREL